MKTTRYHYTPILEWLKFKKKFFFWEYQMLIGMQSNWNCHTFLVRRQNDPVILGNNLAVSYKVKHMLCPTTSSLTPRHLLKWNNLIHRKTCLWMFMVALFIVTQYWKSPQSSFSWRVDKLVHPYNGLLVINKKKLLHTTWVNFKCTMPSESQIEMLYTVWFQIYDNLE